MVDELLIVIYLLYDTFKTLLTCAFHKSSALVRMVSDAVRKGMWCERGAHLAQARSQLADFAHVAHWTQRSQGVHVVHI